MKKVIEVPFVAGLCDKPLSQVSEILEAQGVRQAIDCVDWPNEFPYKPITSFYIARDKECLYINYFVKGNYLRAVNSTDNSPVWEDFIQSFHAVILIQILQQFFPPRRHLNLFQGNNRIRHHHFRVGSILL